MIRAAQSWATRFLHAEHGSTAVEFGLLSVAFISLVVGGIDAGRLAWTVNVDKSATRAGARLAVVSPIVSLWLQGRFSGCTPGNGLRPPTLPVMTCTSSGCTPSGPAPNCASALSPQTPSSDTAVFNAIVARMQQFDGSIQPANVEVLYEQIGLGVIGDPNGCDVSPLVTVRLTGMTFQAGSLRMFGLANFNLPAMSSSLTSEHQVQSAGSTSSSCPP